MIYTRPQGDTRFRTASSKRYPFMSGEFDNELTLLATDVNKGLPKDMSEAITADFTLKKGADAASSATLTLGHGNYFDVLGTTNITGIATKGIGTVIYLHFDGACVITHHATDLILPEGLDILTFAGLELSLVEYDTAKWRMINSNHPVKKVLDRQVTTAEMVSSNTETDLYTYTVPANMLSTNRGLRMVIMLHAYYATASNKFIYHIYYGSTKIATKTSGFLSPGTHYQLLFEVELFAHNATNVQRAILKLLWCRIGALDGTMDAGSNSMAGLMNTLAEDSTGALDFKFAVDMAKISANDWIKCYNAYVELI